jgi:hypothetical protein
LLGFGASPLLSRLSRTAASRPYESPLDYENFEKYPLLHRPCRLVRSHPCESPLALETFGRNLLPFQLQATRLAKVFSRYLLSLNIENGCQLAMDERDDVVHSPCASSPSEAFEGSMG